jgi:flagellar biosynthesis/type III secretory pathway ATPase
MQELMFEYEINKRYREEQMVKAAKIRRANQMKAINRKPGLTGKTLNNVGKVLVKAGSVLQERYSTLDEPPAPQRQCCHPDAI